MKIITKKCEIIFFIYVMYDFEPNKKTIRVNGHSHITKQKTMLMCLTSLNKDCLCIHILYYFDLGLIFL